MTIGLQTISSTLVEYGRWKPGSAIASSVYEKAESSVMPDLEWAPGAPLSPIAFAVKEPIRVSALSTNRIEVWKAHVKAVRPGLLCRVFEDVLFAEARETAYIAGIEAVDGLPVGLPAPFATKQQQFISFLREETARDCAALGEVAHAFEDQRYFCEAAATAAYVVARQVLLHLGVGYADERGDYQLVGVRMTDELLELARLTLPFDQLADADELSGRGWEDQDRR